MIDWKQKLTSRKFWAAVCGFVSMVIMAMGKDAGVAQTVTGMIMAAASLIAYMIGEGLADSGKYSANPGCVEEDADNFPPYTGFVGTAGAQTEESYLNYEENEFRKGE